MSEFLAGISRVFAIAVVGGLLSTALRAQTAKKPVVPASAPEYGIRVEENVWVTMKDGVRLSGHIFFPVGKRRGERFPVLFHHTPYRETAASRYGVSSYLVRRGYVDAHFQVRGTGRSEGAVPDREYSDQEIEDAIEVIGWLARQPWSNGRVGMYGVSWSGFNAAQVAMRRPPGLEAISVGAGTEDLYHENIQYLDGILHFGSYNFGIDVRTTQSPPPDFPLTETVFRNRFDQTPWSLTFLNQQRDGDYWRRGQRLDLKPDAIAIPTFMIGGWVDTYRSSIPRALERMTAPTVAVIGPWNHDLSSPGPAVEYRHQQVRWWDYWLKGRNTGILDEPRVTAYMRYSHPPDPWIRGRDVPGEWRADTWPPRGLAWQPWYLQPNHDLRPTPPAGATSHQLKYLPAVGPQAGQYWTNTQPDQRAVDAFSLVYDSEPLTADLAILGRPKAVFAASATAPLAHWFVRLSDVAPDGVTTLITGAGLNGAHRESSTDPAPLTPGEVYRLEVNLHVTSWVFKPGHRIRVAISNALWPMQWPSPYPMTTTLALGPEGGPTPAAQILLPVVPLESGYPVPGFVAMTQETDSAMPGAPPPPPLRGSLGFNARKPQKIDRDEIAGTTSVSLEDGVPGTMTKVVWRVSDLRPDLASIRGERINTVRVGDRELVWEGFTEIRSDSTNFHYLHRRWVRENGRVVRERSWQDTIPRFFR